MKKKILYVLLLLTTVSYIFSSGLTTFIPRSQGANTARELVGWQQQLYLPYAENYMAHASTFEYTRSFDLCQIARKFFSTSRLTFQGSQKDDRSNKAIIADYFGLATDFEGTLKIEPLIQNVIIDLNFYFGLNEWLCGLYFRVHGPIVHTRWTLGLDPCIVCAPKRPGDSEFPQCYMQSGELLDPQECGSVNPTLNASAQKNFNCTAKNLRTALGGNFTFGDMKEVWKFGRFDFCPRSRTGLADIDAIAGWNFIESDCSHLGLFVLTVVPTGNRPSAKYIFEPIVGSGRHWELGGGLSGHISMYPNTRDRAFNMGLYFEGNITHMFKTHQVRSFDFRENGLLSRYILLKEFNNDMVYNGNLINAINFATRNCDVSVRAKADASCKLTIGCNGWVADLGYNIYFRDCESICIKTDCPCLLDERHFGIKGVEGVCCISYSVLGGIVLPDQAVEAKLNITQPNATMFDAVLPESTQLPDDPESVCLSWNSPQQITEPIPVDEVRDNPEQFIVANTAAKQELVDCTDLDPRSAAQGQMLTHKVFGHIGYTFYDSCYQPHVGIGAEAEFDGRHDNALKQWGTWLKWGFSF